MEMPFKTSNNILIVRVQILGKSSVLRHSPHLLAPSSEKEAVGMSYGTLDHHHHQNMSWMWLDPIKIIIQM
jgi:hypothetical protein